MKPIPPAWWFGLGLGLSAGVFFTSLLAETEWIPSSAWTPIRALSGALACILVVVGTWRQRRDKDQ